MKISDVFIVKAGDVLTEDILYLHQGEIPYVTSRTDNNGINGYVDEDFLNKEYKGSFQKKRAITWSIDGVNAGSLFVQNSKFVVNNHSGFMEVKPEYENEVDLDWFVLKYQSIFYQAVTSNSSKGKLGKKQVENIEIEYPFPDVKSVQLEYKKQYGKLVEVKRKLFHELKILEALQSTIPLYSGNIVKIKVKDIFQVFGGVNGLTEEFLYKNQSSNKENSLKVISSASIETTKMGEISRDAIRVKDQFVGPTIIILRNGNAGMVNYCEDPIVNTDHAYVLKIKPCYQDTINMKWFAMIAQKYTKECISNDDSNATFAKNLFQEMFIEIPINEKEKIDIDFQTKVGEIYDNIIALKRKITELTKEIDGICVK